MARLTVFDSISLDGYFTDANSDMSWAHAQDPEWNAFAAGNASGGGMLVFGRVTYEQMAGFWPTPEAAAMMPEVAAGMNSMQKLVFSRTLADAGWQNTRLVTNNMPGEIRRLKAGTGPDMTILGSGSIVAQLADQNLIDGYTLVMVPVALGGGRSLFEGMRQRLRMTLTSSRTFGNGNVVLSYRPVA